MTRKDFQLIAEVLAESESAYPKGSAEASAIVRTAERFADVLAGTNPRFDRARFLRAAEGYDVVTS